MQSHANPPIDPFVSNLFLDSAIPPHFLQTDNATEAFNAAPLGSLSLGLESQPQNPAVDVDDMSGFPDISALYIDDPPIPSLYAPSRYGEFNRDPSCQTVARVAGRTQGDLASNIAANWKAYKLASAAGTLPPSNPPASMFVQVDKIRVIEPKILITAKRLGLSTARTLQLILQVGERGYRAPPLVISMRKMTKAFWDKQGIDCSFVYQSKDLGISVQGMLSLGIPNAVFARIHRDIMKPSKDPAMRAVYEQVAGAFKRMRESGRLLFAWEREDVVVRPSLSGYRDREDLSSPAVWPSPSNSKSAATSSVRASFVSVKTA